VTYQLTIVALAYLVLGKTLRACGHGIYTYKIVGSVWWKMCEACSSSSLLPLCFGFL